MTADLADCAEKLASKRVEMELWQEMETVRAGRPAGRPAGRLAELAGRAAMAARVHEPAA